MSIPRPTPNPSHVKLSQVGYTYPYSQHGWVLAKVHACIDAFIFIDAYGIDVINIFTVFYSSQFTFYVFNVFFIFFRVFI